MELEKATILVCTHLIYPEFTSSEAIVNKNWHEILITKDKDVSLFSALTSSKITDGQAVVSYKDSKSGSLLRSYLSPKKSALGISFRLLNKVVANLKLINKNIPLYYVLWSRHLAKNIILLLSEKPNSVVWARINPCFSLLPVVEAWHKKQFPLIININDPIESDYGNKDLVYDTLFIQTIAMAQCWTFPSKQLANAVAEKYDLDKARCFVIPHAMRESATLYSGKKDKTKKLKFVYTGTFYKSAFSDSFSTEIQKFSSLPASQDVEFIFVLGQYDAYSLQWIKETIPHATIHTKMQREKVLELTAEADCMIVIDSIDHKALLKGKLIEAISQGLPVFAVTYPDSVMDNVVTEYGGTASYQNVENDICQKLEQMVNNLNSSDWCDTFFEKRKSVLGKISEKNIAKASFDIAGYALERFLSGHGKTTKGPVPPSHYNWP